MRIARFQTFCSFLALSLSAGLTALADVKLPPVISSHMVLQREMPVPIWGTANPGEKVTVKFRDQEKSATADAKGKWMVKLDALKVGGPDAMTINTLKLDDILVGEVWVGSGQSNMDMQTTSYTKGDEVLAKLAEATYPRIRLIRAGNPGWQPATPENNAKFSALLFAFGVPLQKDLDMPLGLLVGAVGGTPSGYWLSEEAFAADEGCKKAIAKSAATYSPEEAKKKYEQDLAAHAKQLEKYKNEVLPKWEKAVQEAKAKGQPEPGKPRGPRQPAPPVPPGQSNGKIGHLYEGKIRPFQPFAIRGVLWDQGESGTAIQGVDQFSLMGALINGWRKEWGQGEFPFIFIQKPSGGGCAFDYKDAVTNKADRFVALPPTPPNNGQYRENHIRIMTYPNTAMAISSDLGPGTHPTNKSGYGVRAARVAMAMAYKKPLEYYGPVYQSHKIEGDKVRISFTHVGAGLVSKNAEALQGFAIAGEDKVFYWAKAMIDGNDVIVSSEKVAKPVAVRYGWASTHPWATLFNKDGLPGIPFRTDEWEK